MINANCIFCKIVSKDIPSTTIYEDQEILGIVDITPQAKTHLLFIHKTHCSKDVNEMVANHPDHLLKIFTAIKNYTVKNKIDQKGFRVVTNLGKDGGQTVFHTHFHLLAGEQLGHFGA